VLKRLYDWVLHWAETPYGLLALLLLAFSESSFFPIPPDVLLIALAISIPSKSLKYALICTVGSILGGAFGYFLGLELMKPIGLPIINFYGLAEKFKILEVCYHRYDIWVVATAGFTILPYKLITITAGAVKLDFSNFMLASAASRAARFFLIAGLIYFFGDSIKPFIDRYINILSVIFIILLIVGFLLIKYFFNSPLC